MNETPKEAYWRKQCETYAALLREERGYANKMRQYGVSAGLLGLIGWGVALASILIWGPVK